ncbi:hypothetical protein [Streptomyces sparsogenes]|uniref:Uncharacterized protein n=1 Tax=Streptomyces sparsogenes DSM 40356 TaxID=1331668 RepID=A0A1R1S861_9ACTN|nr:hypothetical protein [Streptomyces sparsogenes]OMI34413.1 hypothetical protein SPAR_36556 [Streptomyces sparsogenes DSM 40356]
MLLVFCSVGIVACLACMYLIQRLHLAHRTTVFTCPVKDCGVSIVARGSSEAELGRLRDLAGDHSKHGPRA